MLVKLHTVTPNISYTRPSTAALRLPLPAGELSRYSAKISLARLAGCESRSGKG
jgi:hypothetical protein